jgi:hypothetical protein
MAMALVLDLGIQPLQSAVHAQGRRVMYWLVNL